MKKRGNVVRVPGDGPGLLMIEGRQFQFSLDGVWQSERLPRLGQLVEVEVHHELAITTITPVPEAMKVPAKARQEESVGLLKQLLTKLRVVSLLQIFNDSRPKTRRNKNS